MNIDVNITDNSGAVKEALNSAIQKALETCGLLAEGYAKQLAPVDTGNLRNSITHEVDMSEPAMYVGTNVEYSTYVETGTRRQKAQPYIKPAIADNIAQYREIIENELKNG